MTSTAIAAQIAADKPGAAAIASMEAGTHYGLTVIDGNIEDNKNNVTRFAVIGGEMPHRTGRDKTALMFEIPHKPGSLADAMLVFKRGRLNLTWIESFPMPGLEERVSVLRRARRAPDRFAREAGAGSIAAQDRPAGGAGKLCAGGDAGVTRSTLPPLAG